MTMTVDEIHTILLEIADTAPEIGDVPDDLPKLLRQIADWVHISQPGFAKSELEHMVLECRVLIFTLQGTRDRLANMAFDAEDTYSD
jgi:hypothetical protein